MSIHHEACELTWNGGLRNHVHINIYLTSQVCFCLYFLLAEPSAHFSHFNSRKYSESSFVLSSLCLETQCSSWMLVSWGLSESQFPLYKLILPKEICQIFLWSISTNWFRVNTHFLFCLYLPRNVMGLDYIEIVKMWTNGINFQIYCF